MTACEEICAHVQMYVYLYVRPLKVLSADFYLVTMLHSHLSGSTLSP